MSAALDWVRSLQAARVAEVPRCLTDAPADLPAPPPMVVIVERGGELVVRAPHVDIFEERMRVVPGARYDQASHEFSVPVAHKRALWGRIVASFPKGTVVVGKRGRTVL